MRSSDPSPFLILLQCNFFQCSLYIIAVVATAVLLLDFDGFLTEMGGVITYKLFTMFVNKGRKLLLLLTLHSSTLRKASSFSKLRYCDPFNQFHSALLIALCLDGVLIKLI